MAFKLNPTLTNYARGLVIDRTKALTDFLAPVVPVSASTGQYKEYNDKDAFLTFDDSRAIGGEAKELSFSATDAYFHCKPHGLKIPIDDEERKQAGDGDPLGLEKGKISTLVNSIILSRENRVWTGVKAAVAATGGVGVWGGTTGAGNNPIEELDGLIENLATNTVAPNRMVIGLSAWKILRNHPKVLARFPGSSIIGVTVEQFKSMLMIPEIDIRIGTLAADTTKAGKTASKSLIVGADIFMFYANQTPDQYDYSFAKTFRTSGGAIDGVYQYREDGRHSDVFEVAYSEEVKVVAPLACKRVTVSSVSA